MNLVDDLDGMGRRALLCAHLHQLAILPLGLDQKRPFGGVVAAWLLYIDMLTSLQPGNRHRSVPVVGAGDGDSVHILQLENLAKVFFTRGSIAQRLLRTGSEFLHYVAVYIAQV